MVIRKTVFIQLSFLDCSTVIKYIFVVELSNLLAKKTRKTAAYKYHSHGCLFNGLNLIELEQIK